MCVSWNTACLAQDQLPALHKSGMVAHTCNSGPGEVEAGKSEVQSTLLWLAWTTRNSLLKKNKTSCLKNDASVTQI